MLTRRPCSANYELEASLGQIYLAFVKINKKVERNIKTLPSYLWLAVLPQMVSRVVHKNETLFRTLEKILLSVISNFPHQAFWGMAAGPKSTVAVRSRRSLNILSKAKVGLARTCFLFSKSNLLCSSRRGSRIPL